MSVKGLIFNIQRFSIHDGPGIRTTVFFKGCSLRCFWCHNPESIDPDPQIQVFPQKCIGCGKCFEVCPANAHQMKDGQRVFLRELCKGCGMCAETCYAEALVMTGKWMTVQEVMDEVEKDKPFYENSQGGLTLSGGEPLLQGKFAKELLEESKKRQIHTVVDTAGNVPWETFEAVLPFVDLFLYDIKVMGQEKHREVTGATNTRIINNLKNLVQRDVDVRIRVPVIPGVNDTPDEMEKIALFLKNLPSIQHVELLPFHNFGEGKYDSLGYKYKAKDYRPPQADYMNKLIRIFKDRGLEVKGGNV